MWGAEPGDAIGRSALITLDASRNEPNSVMRAAVDWMFRDRRTGKITIAQFPNLPLWIFLASLVAGRLAAASSNTGATKIADGADLVASGALAWWGVDEIVRGVNPWRRMLGVGGATYAVYRLTRG